MQVTCVACPMLEIRALRVAHDNRDSGATISEVYGRIGPATPWLGKLAHQFFRPFYLLRYLQYGVHRSSSRFGQQRLEAIRRKIAGGHTAYIAGIVSASHNCGVGLIKASRANGIELLANDEEERFTGVKHYDGYPVHSVALLKERLNRLGLQPGDIDAFVTGWDYPILCPMAIRTAFEHFPNSLQLALPSASPSLQFWGLGYTVQGTPARLAKDLGLPGRVPLITLPHHDNHAAVGFAASPFSQDPEPVMITVLDGFGDEGAISLYVAEGSRLRVIRKNHSLMDSLGVFYSVISSTKGGWTTLSSEGRYMGAGARGAQHRADRLGRPRPTDKSLLPPVAANDSLRLRWRNPDQSIPGELVPRR